MIIKTEKSSKSRHEVKITEWKSFSKKKVKHKPLLPSSIMHRAQHTLTHAQEASKPIQADETWDEHEAAKING